MTPVYIYRWATREPRMSMPLVEDLERDGYEICGGDDRYPASILMRRPEPDGESEATV